MASLDDSAEPRPAFRSDRLLLGLIAANALAIGAVRVRALDRGWQLVGDDAVIALRSTDVFSRWTPSLGLPSAFNSWSWAADPFHPGPSVYWWLAPWTSLFGASAPVVLFATWALSVLSIVTITITSHRQLGRNGAIAGLGIAVAFQVATLAPTWFNAPGWKPLNPVLAALPCLAFCFLTWAVVAGDRRLLPVWVGFGSFVVQADLAYVPIVVIPGLVVLGSEIIGHRRTERPVPTDHSRLAALVVGTVMWVPAVANALRNRGGNAREILVAAAQDVPVIGWRAAPGTLSLLVDPTWFLNRRDGPMRIGELAVFGWGSAIGLGVLILCLRGVKLAGRETRAAAVTAGALAVGAIVSQSATPTAAGTNYFYLIGTLTAAAFVWFTVILLAPDGLRALRSGHPRPSWTPSPQVAVVCQLAAAAVIASLLVSIAGNREAAADIWLAEVFPVVEPLGDTMAQAVSPGAYELRPLGGPTATAVAQATILHIDRHGILSRTEPPLAKYLGANRLLDGTERGVLYLATDATSEPPAPGATLVATERTSVADPAELALIRQTVAANVRADRSARATGVEFWIGSILAASGEGNQPVGPITDERLITIGRDLVDNPRRLARLSDTALSELVGAGLLTGAREFATPEQEWALYQVSTVSVWIGPPN